MVTLVRRRSAPGAHPDLPWISLEAIPPGGLAPASPSPRAPTVAGWCFQAGDLLLGRLRPSPSRALLAEGPGVASAEWLVLRPRPGVDPGWLLLRLASPELGRALWAAADGTRMPRVEWAAAGQLPLQRPAPPVERALGRAAGAARALAAALGEEERALRAAMSGLSQLAAARPERQAWGDLVEVAGRPVRGAAAGGPFVGIAQLPREGGPLTEDAPPGAGGPRRAFQAGDLLIGRARPDGRWALATADGRATPEVVVFRPRGSPAAAVLAWQAPGVGERAAAATDGTRLPRLDPALLATWPVPVSTGAERAAAEASLRRWVGLAAQRAALREVWSGLIAQAGLLG